MAHNTFAFSSKISRISWEDVTNEPRYFIKSITKFSFQSQVSIILKREFRFTIHGKKRSEVKQSEVNRTDGPINQTSWIET